MIRLVPKSHEYAGIQVNALDGEELEDSHKRVILALPSNLHTPSVIAAIKRCSMGEWVVVHVSTGHTAIMNSTIVAALFNKIYV